MAVFHFSDNAVAHPREPRPLAPLLDGFSIEVLPGTAAKIAEFRPLLPAGTRVYVAHIEGTDVGEVIATARRLTSEGFTAMPHIPARLIADRAMLADWIARYREEAGVTEALLLAGGAKRPAGRLTSSIDMLSTGLFEEAGFTRLHVAGHPEGNRDIDPDGGDRTARVALRWKSDYAAESPADFAIVTQFAFEAQPIIAWARSLREDGIALPIHLGLAGPARLQTLIRYAIACGVGPSLRVLERRARDVTRLLAPYAPTELALAIAREKAAAPGLPIERLHLFPLGGIAAAAEWARENGGRAAAH